MEQIIGLAVFYGTVAVVAGVLIRRMLVVLDREAAREAELDAWADA